MSTRSKKECARVSKRQHLSPVGHTHLFPIVWSIQISSMSCRFTIIFRTLSVIIPQKKGYVRISKRHKLWPRSHIPIPHSLHRYQAQAAGASSLFAVSIQTTERPKLFLLRGVLEVRELMHNSRLSIRHPPGMCGQIHGYMYLQHLHTWLNAWPSLSPFHNCIHIIQQTHVR